LARAIADIFEEARRRRVFQTTGVYIVAVWGLSQGAVELAPALGYSTSIVRWILSAGLMLLPGVVVLAWKFDVSRQGIVRDPEDQPTLGVSNFDGIATMPTAMGGADGAGALLVRWGDADGPGATLFREEFFIGRGAECRVRFYDPLVSRKHARVYPEAGVWMVEDLGSRNGTLLDEQRIAEPVALVLESTLRVNESGPVLRLEHIAAGAPFQAALMQHRDAPTVAHVRAPARDLAGPRGSGVRGA
jgi:hypothetical protein